jgi:SAM-dependent methyltransferase
MPRAVLAETADEGDFLKQHLVNPALTRMLGDVAGRRVLGAGCGNGYFSRMLARAGAEVTGIEPAGALFSFATGSERAEPLGIRYRQADLCSDRTGPRRARTVRRGGGQHGAAGHSRLEDCSCWLRGRPAARRPAGLQPQPPLLRAARVLLARARGVSGRRVPGEYDIPLRYATDFHRPLSAYLNEVIRIAEIAEPGLDPAAAAADLDSFGGRHPYVHLPNFLIVAADRT